MVSRNWSYFESYIYIRNQRFFIDPNENFVTALCTFYKFEKQLCNYQRYQCLCGACAFTVTRSFQQHPISCSCTFENPSSLCPNLGCSDFLKGMRKCFKYPADEVMWGFTHVNHLEGDFGKTKIYVPPFSPSSNSLDYEFEFTFWTVYKCCSCDFITHALKKNIDQSRNSTLKTFDAAVVTSIPVDHTKQLAS